MNVSHVGLVYQKESDADRFFLELLGLSKGEVKTLPAELAKVLFLLEEDIQFANYLGGGAVFEVFFVDKPNLERPIAHTCLETVDLENLLKRAGEMGLEVRKAHKGDKSIYFLKDFAGNLYEIKSAE